MVLCTYSDLLVARGNLSVYVLGAGFAAGDKARSQHKKLCELLLAVRSQQECELKSYSFSIDYSEWSRYYDTAAKRFRVAIEMVLLVVRCISCVVRTRVLRVKKVTLMRWPRADEEYSDYC